MWQKHIDYMNSRFGERWQDNVIVVLQFAFIVSMLPTIFGGGDWFAYTAFGTAIAVSIFVYIYATLKFWKTVVLTAILTIEWWIVALQTL